MLIISVVINVTIKDEAEIAEALSYLCEEYQTSCKKKSGSVFSPTIVSSL